jgi:hypothetical protein
MTRLEKLIHDLREEMAKIETIDPCSPVYERLEAFLDSLDTENLIAIRDADVKFMSMLAANRVRRREANASG